MRFPRMCTSNIHRSSFRTVSGLPIAEVANASNCVTIAKSILKQGGSAVDAAIAMLLCAGVINPHSSGIGGGFLMTIWDAKRREAAFLNARETAPSKATENMFKGKPYLSYEGGLAVGIPGEIKGCWEAHQRYGKLKWSDLFKSTIELCNSGCHVTEFVANYLKLKEWKILRDPGLCELFIDPQTNQTWTVGKKFANLQLAETLEKIATNGAAAFYEGEIAEKLTQENQEMGGILTLDDFKNYRAKWMEPIKSNLGNYVLYTAPPPGSGIILAFILNVLKNLMPANSEEHLWQRIIETFKWAYARRTELGDPDFIDMRKFLFCPISENSSRLIEKLTSPKYAEHITSKIKDDETCNTPLYYGAQTSFVEDAGTAHIVVVAEDQSAVSVTSTINHILGAMIRSPSTGIILNDEMDDFGVPGFFNMFGVPPSPNNFIKPGKCPVSSMAPTIILDSNASPRLVIGSSGGTKITSSIAIVTALNLWSGCDLKEALATPRLHHQLFPMHISFEATFNKNVLKYLESIGHKVKHYTGMNSRVVAAAYENKQYTSYSDQWREGIVS